jgi:hypothetical protein
VSFRSEIHRYAQDDGAFELVAAMRTGARRLVLGAASKSRFIAQITRDGAEYLAMARSTSLRSE